MGSIRGRTREYGCRGKVRGSRPAAAAAAGGAGAGAAAGAAAPLGGAAAVEDGEAWFMQMLDRLLESLDQLREEIAMGFARMDHRFRRLDALHQALGRRGGMP